ncbi:uncharacterized protein LOC114945911 isoform X2 [Nylanderia fulva]|nr:uncharacterized protein LOC114945911 isoform X2 [Nylanderia fulva]
MIIKCHGQHMQKYFSCNKNLETRKTGHFCVKFALEVKLFMLAELPLQMNFVKDEDKDETSTAIEFHDLSDLLIKDDIEDMDAEDSLILPSHHRCVSHSLNLVAVKDSEKALDNDVSYKKLYRLTFAKLTKLWSKQNQSTQISDKIKEILGVYLKTPVITRWNSTFDSVMQLATFLKNDPDQINQCLDHCNLQRLTENEMKFILVEEYCQ